MGCLWEDWRVLRFRRLFFTVAMLASVCVTVCAQTSLMMRASDFYKNYQGLLHVWAYRESNQTAQVCAMSAKRTGRDSFLKQ